METTKWSSLFKYLQFKCDHFLPKDSTNSEWQWGTDTVSHTQILFHTHKCCIDFPATSTVLCLKNLTGFVFLHNHCYER